MTNAPPNTAPKDRPSANGASKRGRDLGFAVAVLLLAVVIAGVLFYGNWWRQNHLNEAYRAQLQTSLLEYQQVVSNEDPDADQVYLLGAKIDVIMRRIADQLNEPEIAWRNFEFLRQHAYRLEALFSSTSNWDDPTLLSARLGEIKRRISGYEARSDGYLGEVAKSKSTFGNVARLRQIEDEVVRGDLGQNSIDTQSLNGFLTRTSRVLLDCLAQSAENQPPALQPSDTGSKDTKLSDESVYLRGIAVATWLISRQDQQEKLAELERVLDEESRNSSSSKADLQQANNRTEALLAISQLMTSLGGDPDQRSVEASLKRFDRNYRYRAKETDGILGQAMAIRFQAVTADWLGIANTISELSQTNTVSRREVAFLRHDASRSIMQLLGSESWLNRIEGQLQIEKGLETAVNLSRYSPDTFEMLMATGVAGSTGTEKSRKLLELPSIDARVVEAAKASPSSIIAMTTEAISAGINQDDVQLNDVVASETMLNVGLTDMLANMATWRLFAKPAPDSVEVKLWIMLMESITLVPETNQQKTNGNALLALAGWQKNAGDHRSAAQTLEAANLLVGDTQLFIQIEDLMNRISP